MRAEEIPCDKLYILRDSPPEQFEALATSHFFFKDGDSTPVAHVNRHGFVFLDTEAGRAAHQKRETRLAALQAMPLPLADRSEVAFQRRIVAELEAQGVTFECQKRCKYGIMDIFIHGEPASIIELKADGLQDSIRRAIGQLAFYSSEFPDARLYIAVPGGLNRETRLIIQRWGMAEWKL